MHAPALTLVAEFWHRHRLGLAGVMALIAAFAVASAVSPLSAKLASIHSMWFVMGLAYVIGVFAYGFDGKLESGESGFPARLFVLPVRTSVLVAGPMLQGVLVAVGFWFAWDHLVLRPAGVELPAWWTALIAAIVAASQALAWLAFGVPFLRILVMVAALTALIRAGNPRTGGRSRLRRSGRAGRRARRRRPRARPALLRGGAIGVGRARRGDSPHWFTAASAASAAAPPRMGRPFSSPARAQLWYEWCGRGRGFCLVLGLTVVALAVLGALVERDPERQTNYGFVFLLLPIILAATWGPYAGTAGAACASAAASRPSPRRVP